MEEPGGYKIGSQTQPLPLHLLLSFSSGHGDMYPIAGHVSTLECLKKVDFDPRKLMQK